MKANNKISLKALQFVPVSLIVFYKMVIDSSSVSTKYKMMVLYFFIAASVFAFGYLLFYKKQR